MKGIQKQTAPLLVIGAGICWGIIGLFSKQLAALGFSPIQITFGRSVVTAVVMVLAMLCQSPRRFAISWRDSWMFLGAKMLGIDTILGTVCIVEKSIYSGGLVNVGRRPAFFML